MRFGLTLLLVGLLAGRFKDRFDPGALRVTFFDVGQGDAALLRFPQGKVWLVDAGGGGPHWNWGMRDLYLELSRMGVLTVDLGILTHPDADHLMGFFGLLPQIRFEKIWFNPVFDPQQHPRLGELLELATSLKTAVVPLRSEVSSLVDGVSIRAHPLPKGANKNDSPVALWLQYGACRILLAGDAEKAAEQKLLSRDPNTVDLLKVNHHGSRTSSSEAFVARLRPLLAVASLGATNAYGHPAPSVVRRFARFGVRQLRTDQHGFVEISVSKNRLSCRSAKGDCGTFGCRARERGL